MAQGLIAIALAESAAEGASLEDLLAQAQRLIPKVGVIAMLDTLEHLQKGGRVGGAKALLGQVLSIKPLLKLEHGIVAEAGRQRTTSRALRHLADEAARHAPLERLAIFHGDSSQLETLTALVAPLSVQHPIVIADVGPTVGTHGGPGVIGLAWLEA
jgi:DegV family protein with EDD domain